VNVRGSVDDLELVRKNVDSVAFGARCSLATQHQLVIASFLAAFGPDFEARVERGRPRGEPLPIVPMADLRGGVATLDDDFARKQPDWTFGSHWSGKSPADRLDDHRRHEQL
jgi:hypothetical protein